MAALKADPAKPLPFEATDATYMAAYFSTVLDPLHAMGVSFWWLDWQQWKESKAMPGLSNTWWLNHVFFTHMQEQDDKRALIYHRWGGLGNHRYQVGFSGDSIISWGSLAFQPRFTATASNVLYGYWSHDLGGHTFRDESDPATRRIDPELYIRWMQFGAWSPIMRTHTTKNPNLTKEPWRFAPAQFDALRDTVLTRYTFLPYTYTMGRKAYDTGVSLVRPMYYGWPDNDEAYKAVGEYMFGDDLLVSPVTAAGDANGFTTHETWLPAGNWFDTTDGSLVKGGRTFGGRYRLDEVPVFVRAGAIIPTNTDPTVSVAHDRGARTLRVYPGGNGKAELYEDAGDDEAYRGNAFARTALSSEWSKQALRVRIAPRAGSYAGMPTSRQWSVDVLGSAMPVSVTVDGVALTRADDAKPGTWRLTGKDLTLHVTLPEHGYDRAQIVEVRLARERTGCERPCRPDARRARGGGVAEGALARRERRTRRGLARRAGRPPDRLPPGELRGGSRGVPQALRATGQDVGTGWRAGRHARDVQGHVGYESLIRRCGAASIAAPQATWKSRLSM